ncbi:MAG: peptidase [Pseudomonadota bacterium]
MTYCLGILLSSGLVLASDSRTNAGVDQIAKVRKLAVFEQPGSRVIALLSAGNLATTQAVVTTFKEGLGCADGGCDLDQAKSLFEAARMVGQVLRDVLARDAEHVKAVGDPSAGFLLGGQIAGERPRLFQIYSAGNFIEASPRTPFLQIGETKYGKPILDRTVSFELDITRAAKAAILSFDATMRSNLSVAPPIDLLCYHADSFSAETKIKLNNEDPYFAALREGYGRGLLELVDGLPSPPWAEGRPSHSNAEPPGSDD